MSKMSTTMLRVLADPAVRANMSAGATRRWAKAGERARQRKRMKKALGRAEVRERMSKGAVKRHQQTRNTK